MASQGDLSGPSSDEWAWKPGTLQGPHRCKACVTRLVVPWPGLGDPGSGHSSVTRGGLILPSLGSSTIPISKMRRRNWCPAGSKGQPPFPSLQCFISQLLPRDPDTASFYEMACSEAFPGHRGTVSHAGDSPGPGVTS